MVTVVPRTYPIPHLYLCSGANYWQTLYKVILADWNMWKVPISNFRQRVVLVTYPINIALSARIGPEPEQYWSAAPRSGPELA